MIGQKIGQFRITQELGDGGHAFVFKGEGDGKVVAIKMLRPSVTDADENLEKRFIVEAEALKKLNHPNIVGFEGYLCENGHHYLILEFMDRGSVENLIRSMGSIPPRYAIPIMYSVIDSIRFAHDEGYIHRDIKPTNILINADGQAKLSDFGIAKVISAGGQKMTRDGYILGTTEYMAPECLCKGEVSKQTDIYALGVTFYEMLTGRKPFEKGEDEQLVPFARRVLQGKAPPPSTYRPIPEDLERIVMKSIAQDPKNRYKTAKEYQKDLAKAFPEQIKKDIIIPSGRAVTRYVNFENISAELGVQKIDRGRSQMPNWMRMTLVLLVAVAIFAVAIVFESEITRILWPGKQKILTYGAGALLGVIFAFVLHLMLNRRASDAANVLLATPPPFQSESSSSATSSEGDLSGFGDDESSQDAAGGGDTIPFHEGFTVGTFKMTDQSELNGFLLVLNGPDEGRRFGLRPVSRIGRDLRLDIRPKDLEISRHHAAILFEGYGFAVEDLGSLNGTYLNEERVSGKLRLKTGDVVRVGSTRMRFEHRT